MRGVVRTGPSVYGMAAVSDEVPLSPGASLLLENIQSPNPDPLWVFVWGGTNVLAQALQKIRNRPDAASLRSKLRVYAISDQDNTGPWIRHNYPEIFYICSVHGWCQYPNGTWTGISGEALGEEGCPDRSKISHEWIKKHIQIGPLGAVYPDFMFIPEGDTPKFLYLIQNGLGIPEEPSWGSWRGRYVPVCISEQGGYPRGHFADAADEVIGFDGRKHRSNRATIWRWRDAFQEDFAARMQWTLTPDFGAANHHPVIDINVDINGDKGISQVYLDVEAGSSILLDASGTYDPDGDGLSFRWFQYREPSATQTFQTTKEVAELNIEAASEKGDVVRVTVPGWEKSCMVVREKVPLEKGPLLHLILEVLDDGSPSLKSYRRVAIQPFHPVWEGNV